jgi:hypothetical protein
MGGVVKSVTKALKQTVDFGVELVKGVVNVVVALSRVDLLLTKPDDYLKNVGVETFKMFAEPIAVFTGKEFAYQAVYWAAIVAALVVAWYVGPEIVGVIDYIAMLAVEQAAAYVTSYVLIAAVYWTMSAAAMVGSAYLTAYMTTTMLDGVSETYFKAMYGAQEMFRMIEMKRHHEADYSSMLLDGSVYEWMAGGIALNAVMAGGDLSHGAYPNDPYTKAFMYESKGSDIGAAVSMSLPYDNLAGGSMFGLNGSGGSPYHPLMINV